METIIGIVVVTIIIGVILCGYISFKKSNNG